jgi:hypothetical protein
MEDFYRLIIHFGTFEPKTATDFSLFSVTFSFLLCSHLTFTSYYKSTDYFDRTVAATVLPEEKTVQKMLNSGSIGPNFANLLNNIKTSDNIHV